MTHLIAINIFKFYELSGSVEILTFSKILYIFIIINTVTMICKHHRSQVCVLSNVMSNATDCRPFVQGAAVVPIYLIELQYPALNQNILM